MYSGVGASNFQNFMKRFITLYLLTINILAQKEKGLEIVIKTIRLYSQYIAIDFASEKCVIQIIKSGKGEEVEGIERHYQERIRMFGEKENLSTLY